MANSKTVIETITGFSRLTINGITADQAGKYAIAVENARGSDCRFASVGVEGMTKKNTFYIEVENFNNFEQEDEKIF